MPGFELRRTSFSHKCSGCKNVLKCQFSFSPEAERCQSYKRNGSPCHMCLRWMEDCRHTGRIPCRFMMDLNGLPPWVRENEKGGRNERRR